MTLATHGVVGGAIFHLLSGQPALGLSAAFASHFILDAIPHWDYHLRSSREDESNPINNDIILGRDFVFDLLKISADFILGLALSWILFGNLWGALAGMLPDLLQFVYFKTRSRWLEPIQHFHIWIHTSHKIRNYSALGASLQLALILAITLIVYYI